MLLTVNGQKMACYVARYGERWACPVCLDLHTVASVESKRIKPCFCTLECAKGVGMDDPAAPWNQEGYKPRR